jgi:hypothetical protein
MSGERRAASANERRSLGRALAHASPQQADYLHSRQKERGGRVGPTRMTIPEIFHMLAAAVEVDVESDSNGWIGVI